MMTMSEIDDYICDARTVEAVLTGYRGYRFWVDDEFDGDRTIYWAKASPISGGTCNDTIWLMIDHDAPAEEWRAALDAKLGPSTTLAGSKGEDNLRANWRALTPQMKASYRAAAERLKNRPEHQNNERFQTLNKIIAEED